eukprot:TRINITY_DN15658_c0_g2_i1.p1 TRINITY_DN15658_c0_g2~~TRINITY_DN15658_c0_g2_i1.p1  ORF type:complete len:316 (+),score=37.86 TRINITY_DN15658_c0_g2_i1:486-1433(+)
MKNSKLNSQYVGKFLKKDYDHFKDGLFDLLDDYKRKSERLDKIIKQSDKMQLRLLEANEELDEYKNNLELKVEEEIKKREENERLLLEQSKFAAMGEMIDAIAHQWAQPLSLLKMRLSMMDFDFENGEVDKKYILDLQQKSYTIIEHMNNTLNEFRTFFKQTKDIESFKIKQMIEKVLLLVKDEFIKHLITIELEVIDDFEIIAIENEFKHILLNIINNSKDAFLSNNIKDKKIVIKTYKNKNENIIEINDNAGGIEENIINDIFKAHISTKKDEGSGIGLYMSYQIAQKNNTKLSAKNIKDGVQFLIKNTPLES